MNEELIVRAKIAYSKISIFFSEYIFCSILNLDFTSTNCEKCFHLLKVFVGRITPATECDNKLFHCF